MADRDFLLDYYRPIIAQLEQKGEIRWQPSGNGACNCPYHDDVTYSCSVKFGRSGELLIRCHGDKGCNFPRIAAALQRTQREFFYHPEREAVAAPREKLEAVYPYTDEAGNTLYESMRFFPKRFMVRRPDGKGGWINDLQGVRRVPWRLHELVLPENATRTIFVVEGEKKVECLEDLGFLATCNAGGSEKWSLEWGPVFKGHPVCVLPDHDEKGWRHAAVVAKCLKDFAAPLRLVELPGMRLKDDVVNWRKRMPANRGEVREALVRAVHGSPHYDGGSDPQVKLTVLRLELAKALAMSGAV